MRAIRSLSDVSDVLRDHETAINEFRGKLWNLNQRRITNVHPSRDEYDVVVRKELKDFSGGATYPSTIKLTSSADYDTIVFGVGINMNIATGTDVCPPYICAFDSSLVKLYTYAKISPSGQAIIFDILRRHSGADETILTAPISLPADSTTVVTSTDFAIASFYETDLLKLNITQKGTTVPGSGLIVMLKVKRI
jgi:hypothetical protein